MSFFKLAYKSLTHRSFAAKATVISISLSLLLLFSIERIRRSVEESFTQSISGVDLIVGARTSSLNLVLFSVFNIGQPTNNVSFKSYLEIKNSPDVDWTIPYSLGDGHKGYRVVGTDLNFFDFYKVRSDQSLVLASGQKFAKLFDVVIGAEVAEMLKYKVGDQIVVAHGSTSGDSFHQHDENPFTVVGILAATGTVIDRSLYISLESMEAVHHEPAAKDDHSHHNHEHHDHTPTEITSFFVKTKTKTQILNLQREITNFSKEPLVAAIPAVVLSDLWKNLSKIDLVLKVISVLVLIVSLVGVLISLISGLYERRREMAIFRSLGASVNHLSQLILIEVFIILISAIIVACSLKMTLEILFGEYLQNKFGLFLSGPIFSDIEFLMIGLTLILGLIFSLGPVYYFRKKSLKDGLAVK